MIEPLPRSPADDAQDAAFFARYGPWAPLDLDGARTLLAGFDRPWWVVGGYAVDAATGRPREHEDVDVALMASDMPALYDHLAAAGWHVWNNTGGTLRPFCDREREPATRDGQVWIRRSALDPWVVDIVLTPDRDGLWVDKRDPSRALPLDDVTWMHDGVRYLRPEWVIFYKARLQRAKDERDLRAVLPVLDADRRAWLRDAVAAQHPGHDWLAVI